MTADALELLDKAECYGLYGVEFATFLTDAQLRSAYNGLGPAWFPAKLRDALDRLDRRLLPAVLIHDVMFTYGARTKAVFNNANRCLALNGRIIANATYRWCDPRRYLMRARANAYAALCQDFGWSAFCASSPLCGHGGCDFDISFPEDRPDDFNEEITLAILNED